VSTKHAIEHARQQNRATLFLALHRLSARMEAHEFADCLADVATVNARHGPFTEEERAAWESLGAALQDWLGTIQPQPTPETASV